MGEQDKPKGPEVKKTTINIKDDFSFLRDQPIKSSSDDKFEYRYYVDIIKFIIEHSMSPINIGLYGKWGVGKSSILELLQIKLNSEQLKGSEFTISQVI